MAKILVLGSYLVGYVFTRLCHCDMTKLTFHTATGARDVRGDAHINQALKLSLFSKRTRDSCFESLKMPVAFLWGSSPFDLNLLALVLAGLGRTDTIVGPEVWPF